VKISLKGVSFAYPGGVKALDDITLSVAAGEKIAIVGQNGAGKTTLVRHLNGLLMPDSGTVEIGELTTTEKSVAELAARVGYVFQNPDDQLFRRTVKDEIIFGPTNLKYPAERIKQLLENALALTNLAGKEEINPYDLSLTWRKMVTLASIIAMDTPILILDEPTTGQDANSIQRIGNIVQTLNQQGKTIITITHDIDFCAENFDRIIVMGQGKILLDGPAAEVLSQETVLANTDVQPPQITRLGKRLGLKEFVSTPMELIEVIERL
jgi:energy-coupling factor transport system ATP-binding protein